MCINFAGKSYMLWLLTEPLSPRVVSRHAEISESLKIKLGLFINHGSKKAVVGLIAKFGFS